MYQIDVDIEEGLLTVNVQVFETSDRNLSNIIMSKIKVGISNYIIIKIPTPIILIILPAQSRRFLLSTLIKQKLKKVKKLASRVKYLHILVRQILYILKLYVMPSRCQCIPFQVTTKVNEPVYDGDSYFTPGYFSNCLIQRVFVNTCIRKVLSPLGRYCSTCQMLGSRL